MKEPTVEDTKADEGTIVAVRPLCKMKVCEDPDTGEIKVVFAKGCPKGYIERVAGKIATSGVAFEEEREDTPKS